MPVIFLLLTLLAINHLENINRIYFIFYYILEYLKVWGRVIDCRLLRQQAYILILTIIDLLMAILGSIPFLAIRSRIAQLDFHQCCSNDLLLRFIQFCLVPLSIFFLCHSSFSHERIYRCHQYFCSLVISH